MVGAEKHPLDEPRHAPPLRHDSSIDGITVLMAVLLFVIFVSAIVGVVVTTMSGQPTVAIVIALFAAAFFSRVLC
jgi:hypothetical protein